MGIKFQSRGDEKVPEISFRTLLIVNQIELYTCTFVKRLDLCYVFFTTHTQKKPTLEISALIYPTFK